MWSQEKEVASQRKTVVHAENIEDKKSDFCLHVCYTFHTSFMYNVGLINHTYQHAHAGTQEVSKTLMAGVVD